MREYDGGRFLLCLSEEYDGKNGSALLMECARRFCGARRAVCPGEETLRRTPGGKPYFDFPGAPRFSVSHSGGVWGCALSAQRVGFDLERVRERDWQAVAARFFHPHERDFALAGGETAFFTLWTAKESYVKYLGTGIDESFSSFCLAHGGMISGDALGVSFVWPPAPEEYYACVCVAAERAAILNVHQNLSAAMP